MKKQRKIIDMIMNTWWLRHLLFWVLVINYYALGIGMTNTAFTAKNLKITYITQLTYLPGYLLVIYPIIYFLVPRYLEKRKFLFFTIGFLLLFF